MSKTYFISDLHFHHKNILKYEPCRVDATAQHIERIINRYDVTADEIKAEICDALERNITPSIDLYLGFHDNLIVESWNSVVKADDTVWFLGDFILGDKDRAEALCAKLNGHKRMIRGNHDNWSDDFYRLIGFEFVSRYPVILKNKFILSHVPLDDVLSCENSPLFNIYGHIHSSDAYPTRTANGFCACIERHDFKPVRLDIFDNTN